MKHAPDAHQDIKFSIRISNCSDQIKLLKLYLIAQNCNKQFVSYFSYNDEFYMLCHTILTISNTPNHIKLPTQQQNVRANVCIAIHLKSMFGHRNFTGFLFLPSWTQVICNRLLGISLFALLFDHAAHSQGPLLVTRNRRSAWINIHMPNEVYYEIIHPFLNFNSSAIEGWECILNVNGWEWISNFIPHFIMDIITYSRWGQS